MIKITDLKVDPNSLGSGLILTDVTPAYKYADGQKTNEVEGYRYTIAAPEHGLKKITVKIKGKQQIEANNELKIVEFTELTLKPYFRAGEVLIAAVADAISVVGN